MKAYIKKKTKINKCIVLLQIINRNKQMYIIFKNKTELEIKLFILTFDKYNEYDKKKKKI